MKILLTGATGFIGRNLLVKLLKNYKVRAIARKGLNVKDKNLEIARGDIKNSKDVENFVRGVDCIIHAAAVIQGTDMETYDVNVNGTMNLVDAAKKFKIKRFIFLSSENVVFDYCNDAYTNSKREAERIVEELKNYLILRASVVYGKDDDKYISYLIKFIKKYPIIPVLGRGNSLIQPVYVRDLVRCIVNSIKFNIKGIHLVYGADAISYNNMIKVIERHLKVKRLVIHIPLFFVKPLVFIYEKIIKNPKIRYKSLEYLNYDRKHDSSGIYKIFRYRPMTFEDGVRDIIKS